MFVSIVIMPVVTVSIVIIVIAAADKAKRQCCGN